MQQDLTAFGLIREKIKTRKFHQALIRLTSLSNEFSHDLKYLNLLSQALRGIGDERALIKTLIEINTLLPQVTVQFELMSLLYKNGFLNEALDVGLEMSQNSYESGMSQEQMNQHAQLMIKIYIELNDFEGAREILALMSPALENQAFTKWIRGVLALSEGERHLALTYFRESVEIDSLYDQAWVSLGLLHKEMGDLELALGNLETALDINHQNHSALKMYCQWTDAQPEKTPQAIEKIQFYLAENSFDEEISLCHVQKLCLSQSWALARQEIEKLRLLRPDNIAYHDMKKKLGDQLHL